MKTHKGEKKTCSGVSEMSLDGILKDLKSQLFIVLIKSCFVVPQQRLLLLIKSQLEQLELCSKYINTRMRLNQEAKTLRSVEQKTITDSEGRNSNPQIRRTQHLVFKSLN